jgi:hypothetical protein
MSESLRDRISGFVLLAVALVWIALVYQTIAPSQGTEAGPRAFPLFFGYVLAILSFLLLFQGFRAAKSVHEIDDIAALPGELTAAVLTIGGFVIYGMLLEPFGFIPSTAFIVALLLFAILRVRSLLLIAGMAIGLSLGSYLVFGKLLGTYLPPGHIITIYF